jgi:hypothetical protein
MNNLPLCARIGILHGILIGFFFSLWRVETNFAPLATHEFLWAALLLLLLALVCSMFILVIVERYLAGAVFWSATVNAILVTLLTMAVTSLIPPHQFFILSGIWIGIVVGLLIGLVLCRLCLDRFTTQRIGDSHGR